MNILTKLKKEAAAGVRGELAPALAPARETGVKIAAPLWKDKRRGRKEEQSRRKENGNWGLGESRPTSPHLPRSPTQKPQASAPTLT
jgi:hypothetical protein